MKKLILAAALIPTLALAQASAPQETIERTIGNLFIANINLQAQVTDLQKQLSVAQKQIEDLKKPPETTQEPKNGK